MKDIGSMHRHEVHVHGIVEGKVGKYEKKPSTKGLKFECDICGNHFDDKNRHRRTHFKYGIEKKNVICVIKSLKQEVV